MTNEALPNRLRPRNEASKRAGIIAPVVVVDERREKEGEVMTNEQPYNPAIEQAKKRWPVTDRTKITILQPRYLGEAPPLQSVSGAETIEIDAVWLTSEWAGSYLEDWDELIIGRIRKRERWEMVEGEPEWTWDR